MATIRRIHQYWSVRELFYRLLDGAAVVIGLWGAVVLQRDFRQSDLLAAVLTVLVFHFVAEITGLYRNWRGISVERELWCAVSTWLFTVPGFLTLGFVLGELWDLSRNTLTLWVVLTAVILAVDRGLVRGVLSILRAKGYNTRYYAVVGINELAFRLIEALENAPDLGLKLLGFYDDRPEERTGAVPPEIGHKLGNIQELVEHARQHRVDMIYITFPMRAEERIRGILAQLADTTASVYIVPDFFVFQLLHSRWTNIGGLPVVSVYENPFYGIDGFVKRAMDVVLASVLLILFAPLMIAIAILIKATSPGPVFFRQRRYGLDGREIRVWKFRTMTVTEDGDQVTQAKRNDPRVTKIGAFLRRTSLDELPQLFNVLRGEMSLVGPRPHATAHNEEYRRIIQGYMLRHKVKPGMTGLAQVHGCRGETETVEKMQKRVEWDLQYIREWSLWMDIKILFQTIFVVLKGQNAY
ncbi:undecaprenyl-phosphate glucose phosphotransferase [Thermogutta sp.]|uniref:undecaprenyl-phosphate glucose phosphotransferase n=1 Tax=Thermogutta sp. TaxID=1962930 RepID=UPI0032202E8E